jgi:PAS domain-containing protein
MLSGYREAAMSGGLIDLRKRAEELELQRQEIEHQRDVAAAVRDRYAVLFDLAPVGLLVIDVRSTIIDGNATAWQQLGLGEPIERRGELTKHLEWAQATRLLSHLLRGERAVMDVWIRPRSETSFQAQLLVAPDPRVVGRFHAVIVAAGPT